MNNIGMIVAVEIEAALNEFGVPILDGIYKVVVIGETIYFE